MRAFATSLVILLAALASSARADEPWLVSITADFAAPVTTPQSAHYLPGGELAVAVLRPVTPTSRSGCVSSGASSSTARRLRM
jgi:hypothetical protein